MTQYIMRSDYRSLFGMDVHARSVSVRGIDLANGETISKRFSDCPTPAEIASWMQETFPGPHYAAYESGCTGFYLCRELRALGIACDVIAVSSIARSTSDRQRKNDKRDAKRLLHELLMPESSITKVWLPDDECECMRDLARAHADCTTALKRLKQQLLALLLRHGYVWNEKTPTGRIRTAWSKDFYSWLGKIALPGSGAVEALSYYRFAIEDCAMRKAYLKDLITKHAGEERWKPYVDALCCLKGIEVSAAFLYAVEIGDFNRFSSGGAVSNWIGLTPSEHSSGEHQQSNGRITKAGNGHVRYALVEGLSNVASRKAAPKKMRKNQVVSDQIRTHCEIANRRLSARYTHLASQRKRVNVIKIALANEMARWIWSVGRMVSKEQSQNR